MLATLTSIARFYLPPGTLVRVEIADLSWEFLQGKAYLTTSGVRVIELDRKFALDGETFFHELGHHVAGHLTLAVEPGNVSLLRNIPELNLSEHERKEILKFIDQREIEAETWAWKHLKAFEAQFGPFARAVNG